MRKYSFLYASLVLSLLGSAPAWAEPTLTLRAGAHETYDRIVFDGPKNVPFEVHKEGSKASIVFHGQAAIKFPKSLQDDLSRARGFAWASDGPEQTVVSFTVDPASTVKTFVNDSSVVVDIYGKKAPLTPVAETPKPDPAPSPPPTPPTPAPAPVAEKDKPADDGKPVDLKPEAVKPPAPEPLDAPAKAEPKADPAPEPETPRRTSLKKEATPPLVSAANNIPLTLTPTLVATLDPHLPVRAVIYQRAGIGYVIFDKKMTLSVSTLLNGTSALIDIQPFDMPRNSGFRFAVPADSALEATLDGTAWKIFLSKKQQVLSVTTALIPQPDFALGPRLLLPLPDVPDPIRFSDPLVGDDLILVPLGQSQAFNVERYFSNLMILPAAQGLVIKPLTDKVVVRPLSDGIEITAEGGLALSRPSDTGATQRSASRTKTAAAGKSIFDFATWGGKPNESFTQARQRLQQTIVDVPDAERNRARLELARFYFAKGDGEEALSLLTYLLKQVPDLQFHNDFRALLGAAKILAYRSEEGLKDLEASALADQPEVALWQAVGLAQMREWSKAEEKFSTKQYLLAGYPEPFLSRFFVLAIESAMASNQIHEAADWLNYISTNSHSESIDPALSFLRGMIEAKAGRATEARAAWMEARKSNDRLYKVRAELSLIDLAVLDGSMTAAQAADRLEALRFAWRGDDLEVDILRRLGQFYLQAKNIKAGINILSQAIALYPSSSMTPPIKAEMGNVFRDVFLGETGKSLSPLDTLTLYRQYRDLLPTGKDSDNIMIHLSERLVAVDLLDQAAAILEELAKNRLDGVDKSRAVLRLAAIRLLDHKPQEALDSLALLGDAPLGAPLQNERVLLKARAFSELGRDAEASTLLENNPSADAALLRADMAMHGKDWGSAARILIDLVGPPPAGKKPLTPDQAGWIIHAAIAYALTDDQVNLDKLAIDYGPDMAPLPQYSTFLMLTRPEKTGQMRDLAAAQSQLSQVDMFQGFLNTYRKGASPDPEPAKKP